MIESQVMGHTIEGIYFVLWRTISLVTLPRNLCFHTQQESFLRGKEIGIPIMQISGPQNCYHANKWATELSYRILHTPRDGKKLWFSKYRSWTRGWGSASPGNWLDTHSLGSHRSPTESEVGWGQ